MTILAASRPEVKPTRNLAVARETFASEFCNLTVVREWSVGSTECAIIENSLWYEEPEADDFYRFMLVVAKDGCRTERKGFFTLADAECYSNAPALPREHTDEDEAAHDAWHSAFGDTIVAGMPVAMPPLCGGAPEDRDWDALYRDHEALYGPGESDDVVRGSDYLSHQE